MISFWICAALLAAATAVLVLWRAAAAASLPATRPELAVYQRQLAELDELAERGLLESQEHGSARTEAARRLLGAAEEPIAPAHVGPAVRRVALGAAVLAPLAGLAAYLAIGTPGLTDQPYKVRLSGWMQAARADPSRLGPAEMAAVLQQLAYDHPADPTPLLYLAREQAAEGQNARVLITLRDAVRRAPTRPELWIALGQADVAQSDGQVTSSAKAAFERAAQLQPGAVEPRYFLARARIAAGDVQGGLSVWRALLASFAQNDPNRAALADDIAQVEKTGSLQAPTTAAVADKSLAAAPPDQQAFVRSMVEGLAARLKAAPDDPAGWARLIRSYRVLGDETRRAQAAAQARRLFATRPEALKQVAAEDHPAS